VRNADHRGKLRIVLRLGPLGFFYIYNRQEISVLLTIG